MSATRDKKYLEQSIFIKYFQVSFVKLLRLGFPSITANTTIRPSPTGLLYGTSFQNYFVFQFGY